MTDISAKVKHSRIMKFYFLDTEEQPFTFEAKAVIQGRNRKSVMNIKIPPLIGQTRSVFKDCLNYLN